MVFGGIWFSHNEFRSSRGDATQAVSADMATSPAASATEEWVRFVRRAVQLNQCWAKRR